MNKMMLALTVLLGLGVSGCVALAAGAVGAGTVACTQDELDCPVD